MSCVLCGCIFSFFFFKQKTAYEMRISDWSSDVCSADLGDREKTIGSHQVLQFGAAGDVCGMALLRICTIASLRLPIPQRKRDTGIQSAKSRKVVKPGWPDVRSALDLAQARRLSCWSLDVRWRMKEVPQSDRQSTRLHSSH